MQPPDPRFRSLTAFFIPLALQAASQSLTYPLVAMVASAGEGGALNLAGVAQSNTVMFLIGTLGAGLVTSGMVYGASRRGFQRFVSVNTILALTTAAIQAFLCIPFLAHLVFGILLGLPPSIESPAFRAYPWTILLNFLFFLRNPYQVVLYNNGYAGKASAATLSRVGVTLILSPILARCGLVGPAWAMACQIAGVSVELGLSWWLGRPLIRSLPADTSPPPQHWEIIGFNIPLSIGGFLMTFCGLLMAGFVARAKQPEHMLAAYYLAIGVANPIAFAAGRMTNVVLRFPPCGSRSARTLQFAIVAGSVLSTLPLLFLVPGIARWYYVGLQRLSPDDLHLIYGTAIALLAYPLLIGLRSHQEGLAAHSRKTRAILAGNIAYVASLAVAGFEFLELGVPGNLIGPVAITLSNVVGIATVTFMLRSEEKRAVPPLAVQVGQESL